MLTGPMLLLTSSEHIISLASCVSKNSKFSLVDVGIPSMLSVFRLFSDSSLDTFRAPFFPSNF